MCDIYFLSYSVYHGFAIAMICSNYNSPTVCQGFFGHLSYTLINYLITFNRSVKISCMTNHIWISKIHHNEAVPISCNILNSSYSLVSNQQSTHLWYLCIVIYLWRWNIEKVFTFMRSFNTTIKKVGHMHIFLCLGYVYLLLTIL